jgi:hypothetical protein
LHLQLQFLIYYHLRPYFCDWVRFPRIGYLYTKPIYIPARFIQWNQQEMHAHQNTSGPNQGHWHQRNERNYKQRQFQMFKHKKNWIFIPETNNYFTLYTDSTVFIIPYLLTKDMSYLKHHHISGWKIFVSIS